MNVYERLTPLLVEAIPAAIASMKLGKPICAVRIYYYDTTAPSTYLLLRTVSAERRDQIVARKGRDAPFTLWSSGEDCGDGQVELPADPPRRQDKLIVTLFGQVYDQLCGDEDDAEGETMIAFRAMLCQTSRELNARDWAKVCPVTDDFIVAPADGSQHFADDYEDLAQGVPPERLELLRSRRLLGPNADRWDQVQ